MYYDGWLFSSAAKTLNRCLFLYRYYPVAVGYFVPLYSLNDPSFSLFSYIFPIILFVSLSLSDLSIQSPPLSSSLSECCTIFFVSVFLYAEEK